MAEDSGDEEGDAHGSRDGVHAAMVEDEEDQELIRDDLDDEAIVVD